MTNTINPLNLIGDSPILNNLSLVGRRAIFSNVPSESSYSYVTHEKYKDQIIELLDNQKIAYNEQETSVVLSILLEVSKNTRQRFAFVIYLLDTRNRVAWENATGVMSRISLPYSKLNQTELNQLFYSLVREEGGDESSDVIF